MTLKNSAVILMKQTCTQVEPFLLSILMKGLMICNTYEKELKPLKIKVIWKYNKEEPGIVAHTFNPTEAGRQVGGSLNLRPALSTEGSQRNPKAKPNHLQQQKQPTKKKKKDIRDTYTKWIEMTNES